MSPLTRRQLLLGTAGTVAGAAATRVPAMAGTTRRRLPHPNHSGIEHIVVLCMENRSFDHFLGWLPGADGKQAGLSYPDSKGKLHKTHRLTERQGCGFADPDHSYTGGRLQLDGGKMDGFRRGLNDDFALGYYTRDDLPFYRHFVEAATVHDRWFCSILSSTYPNRFYTHAGRTDRTDNSMTESTLPTIWDRLSHAGVPANYYFSDLPFLALWGQKYVPIARPFESFYAQAASGTLPAYSYLDPFFLGEGQGGSNDDHPHADIHRGQALVSEVVHAITTSPLWSKTVLIVTYDEWGGFFDHVRPPVLPDDRPSKGFDHRQAGFRVPAFVLSPFSRPGHVEHHTHDHTSILKLVEWRYGLKPLAPRDAAARNIALSMDFSRTRKAPSLPVIADPGAHICGAPGVGMAAEDPFWVALRDKVKSDPAWRHVV
ncbi:MAG: alkaline phosphatase family protein [Frankiales bacterium]|nr:alkaline phosphatase family protein [Frankiales bacterium]